MKENKPHFLKCESCNYQSNNQSEYIMIQLVDQNDTRKVMCLDCCRELKMSMMDYHHNKIAEAIKSRKDSSLVNSSNILFLFDPRSKAQQNKSQESLINTSESIVFPKDILSYLDSRIIGQTEAKRKISVAISNHLQRISHPESNIEKSNILLMGPTGSGKTEFFRTISKHLNLPFISVSATNLTAAGYVGQDVNQILAPLVQSCKDPFLAQKGIVFIDEIDKLAGSDSQDSGINTIRVQQELLKMIEGDIVQVNIGESKAHPNIIDIDTKDILFICAGAFSGLESQVLKANDKVMGIGSENTLVVKNNNWMKDVTTENLIQYGLIPELLGRLPVLTYTEELTIDILERILTEPEQAITKQKKTLFEKYGVKSVFHKSFIHAVAVQAQAQKIGARGLKRIFEEKINDFMFDIDKYQDQVVLFSEHGWKIISAEIEDKSTQG